VGLLLSPTCFGYYHFVQYTSVRPPYQALVKKFDLQALAGRKLRFVINRSTLPQLHADDTFAALVSQVRMAAEVWNTVETSELRLEFGGFVEGMPTYTSPVLEIRFEDLPGDVLAQGGAEVTGGSNGFFLPIERSVVKLRRDLSDRRTYSEDVFRTLVHEIGHALGLQHTWTSSAMSTAVTRSTSKALPLAADDVAGLSSLYPTAAFASNTGTITGRVLLDGRGVALASVVAIPVGADAVSVLTHPDGTYKLEGLLPGEYKLYVHPLPPPLAGQNTPGDIVYPLDADGNRIERGPVFRTQFHPESVDVTAGGTLEANFNVQPKASDGIHSVSTYSFPGTVAVRPAYLAPGSRFRLVAAFGYNLVGADGLKARLLNGADLLVSPYSPDPANYVRLDLPGYDSLVGWELGPKHAVFSTAQDVYVLPAAFRWASILPPFIQSVTSYDGGKSVAVTGDGLNTRTRILFDGVAADVLGFDGPNRVIVAPPAAPPGYRAAVVALNADGQSSLFLQGDKVPVYEFGDLGAGVPPAALGQPKVLTAGGPTGVVIELSGLSFEPGKVQLSFGGTDVRVRRLWVAGASRLFANLEVSEAAQSGYRDLTVISGLHVHTLKEAVQIEAPPARTFTLQAPQAVIAGREAQITAVGASASTLEGVAVYLRDQAATVVGVTGNQITFRVPAGAETGPAMLRVEAGSSRSTPLVVQVDPPAARIVSAQVATSFTELLTRAAKPEDVLAVVITELPRAASVLRARPISAKVGGKPATIHSAIEQGPDLKVFVLLPADVSIGAKVPLQLNLDGHETEIFDIAITR
jgi:uncharacterized protein (TIGR03437 family)